MGTLSLLQPMRRVGVSLITRLLRKQTEQREAKKHPERKSLITKAIKKKVAEKKKQFKKKFPTRKERKRLKTEFKLKTKKEKELYKSSAIYRLSTVPRADRSEKYDMGAYGLRYEAKHGSSMLTRTQSAKLLKRMTDLKEGFDVISYFLPASLAPNVKYLNPWKRKKKSIEEARAKLDLSGDI